MYGGYNVEELMARATHARAEFAKFNQETVDRIFLAVAHAADKQRVQLALLAFEETKMGLVEDKVLKNGLAAELIRHRYKDTKTCGIIAQDKVHGITKFAEPVAGAPEHWIQCVVPPPPPNGSSSSSPLALSNAIMKHPQVNLILATGGPGMVKASYSTGHPAIGVGSGNAPILVDETADLKQAVGSIVLGKTFDNGMICAAEQCVVCVEQVYAEFKALLEQRGCYFLYGDDRTKLEKYLIQDGRVNIDVVGQSAIAIAKAIGVQVPKGTVVLAAEESKIGPEAPLSHEKLSPILALYRVENFDKGVQVSKKLALYEGVGHTAGIYSRNPQHLEEYGLEMPVGRILANMPTSISAIGTEFNNSIDPSFTLGVGTMAGSSVSENVGPMHLLNIKTLAIRQQHIEWYKNPPDIYYNRGCLEEALADCARPMKSGDRMSRCIIVTDKVMGSLGYVERLKTALVKHGFVTFVFDDVNPDPDMATVRKGMEACNHFKPDLMVCLGGGSPMDAGKFIRALYEHPELSLEDAAARFLELRKRTCPFPILGSKIKKVVCIPTTSGTASEVTPFSVITDDDGMKHPLFSYRLTPDIAIIDSSFCEQLPKGLVAFAGIDAITHATEALVSVAANDFTQGHGLRALELLTKYLVESYQTGNIDARGAVHHGATLAGLAFSNSFLGICHSLAHKMGAAFHLPHGLTCGILLPHVIRYNSCVTPTRMGVYPGYDYPKALEQYANIGRHLKLLNDQEKNGKLSYTDEEWMEAYIAKLYSMYEAMNVPTTFKDAGCSEEKFLQVIHEVAIKAFDDQCTPANPRFPLVSELEEVLMQSFYGRETAMAMMELRNLPMSNNAANNSIMSKHNSNHAAPQ
ncbi:hypothetical protein ACA910_015237 [Epithemia clementina (nom. ined.)]